jgi:autotransporter-associated beta strand protein
MARGVGRLDRAGPPRSAPSPVLVALFAGLWLLPLVGRLCGQTTVWIGGPSHYNYSTASNWSTGVVPPNDGTYTLEFTDSVVNYGEGYWVYASVAVDESAVIQGLTFLGSSGNTFYSVYGYEENSVTIGAGGITAQPGVTPFVSWSIPVVLSASQTWNSNNGSFWVYGNISETGGSQSLTTMGNVELEGTNTFSGGLNVASGMLFVGSNGAAGTGTLTLSDGTSLLPWGVSVNLPNPVSLGNNVTFANRYSSADTLTLSGAVTAANAATTLNLGYQTTLILSGSLAGPASPPLNLTVSGNGSTLPGDGGSLIVIEGTLNNVSGLSVSNAAMILAPVTSPATAFASLSPTGLQVGSDGTAYLGLDGAFTQTNAVATFLSTYGPSLGASINGTLGFDTFASPASPQTFNDPINLVNFTSPNFIGLGSATSAILGAGATITPAGTTNNYLFGGGGGTLTVNSALPDSDGTQLIMNYAPEPLTLILQGSNTYTGGTTVYNGVLIFNSAPPAGAGSLSLYNGYIGYADLAGISIAQQFVNLFNTNAANGVIGFDSDSLISPRTIAGTIDLSAFSGGENPFLGTATAATISAAITPANARYQFAGVKGGQLTVSSMLTGAGNSVVVGLPSTIETNGSVSSVTLSGTNTYAGGTTLNSGILYVTNSSSLGTGPLTTPGYYEPVLAPSGGDVALGNAIAFDYGNLTLGQSGNANLLTLNGVISGSGSLDIVGNVALNGANTFTGGTSIGNYAQAVNVAIGNPSALGAGPVYLYASSSLTEDIANPTITDLTGDYGTTINLIPNSTLTLNTDSSVYQPARFSGSISGDFTDQLVKTGTGAEYLDGTSNYGGGTTVNGGVLIAGSGAALGTGTVTVAAGAGLGVASGVTLANPVILIPGSGLGGMGMFSPPAGVTFAGGSKVSPGSDGTIAPFVATLSFGTTVTFGTGGVYEFDIQTASGAAGTDYDTLSLGSTLAISATPALPFVINVRSIDPATGQLGLASFNSSQAYTWTLLSAGSITGFDPTAFYIDTSSFQNPLNGGSFFVSDSGSALDLNFTPVPEPATWLLMMAGLATLGARIRGSRRPESPSAPSRTGTRPGSN